MEASKLVDTVQKSVSKNKHVQKKYLVCNSKQQLKKLMDMNVTKEQTTALLSKFLEKENGLNDVLEMMLCERTEYLKTHNYENKGNGYRLGKVFGHGAQIELKILQDRQSDFHPTILALFRD